MENQMTNTEHYITVFQCSGFRVTSYELIAFSLHGH